MKLVLLFASICISNLCFSQILEVTVDAYPPETNVKYSHDSVITYYPDGSIKLLQLDHEREAMQAKKGLPVIFLYREDGSLEMHGYLAHGAYHNVWYSESNAHCPERGDNEYGTTFHYKNCKMVRKESSKSYWGHSLEMPVQKNAPYCIEEGTFKNFILDNGTMKYYTPDKELVTTVIVKNGRRQNDPIVYFKDEILKTQILKLNKFFDLNKNGHIEKSEASVVTELRLSKVRGIASLVGLSYFKHLRMIRIGSRKVQVKDYSTHEELLKAIIRNAEEYPIPPGPIPPPPIPLPEKAPEIEIVEFCDIEAQFPGGTAAMKEWIDKNMIYPQEAINIGEQGRVYVSFVVETDGSLSNVKVERGVSKSLDREAKRIIRAMPRWIPGERNMKTVRSMMRLPILFIIK